MNHPDLAPGSDAQPCNDIKDQIHSYFNGMLTDLDEIALMRHLEGCAACREYFEEMQAADGGLGAFFEGEEDPARDN